MLMWAHYSNHNGFQATYNVKELEKLFHGPFPINYVEQAEKFDINNDPHLSIVYLSNVKSKCWSYEDEWRCIAESKDALSLPNRPDLILKERKFFYSQETLREIILGFNFFPVNRIFGKEDDFIIYDLSDNMFNLQIDLLDFLVTEQIPTSLIHLINNLDFKLTKNEIRIAKFGNKKYGFNLKSMK
jgi:hypothetical protein